MSNRKVTIEVLNESLLQESSKPFQESTGLEWEWEHFNKLYNIVNQIQEKEASRNAQQDFIEESISDNLKRRLQAVPNFMEWLNKHGVSTTKLVIQDVGSYGLGLVTQEPISAGDEVLVIPETIMMTTMNARKSKLGIIAEKDPVIRSMANVLLSLYLLYEKYISKEASFWKTYIDLLPSSYDTVLFFTLEDMLVLKNSHNGFREALRMYRNIVRQYAYFHAVFRKATDSGSRALRTVFTFTRYAWAASTAMTRQNNLISPDKTKEELCLIPLWDMCNHEANGQFSNAYHPDEQYLACYATHDYEVGKEFLIYYGERTSVQHFVHGGFVPDICYYDSYNLEIGIGIHDKQRARKEAILKEFGLKCQESFNITIRNVTEISSLFVFVHLFQADKEFLDVLHTKSEDLSFLTNPTVDVWKFLAIRFSILHASAKNSEANMLKSVTKNKEVENHALTNRQKTIHQLMQNDVKLLEILAKCAKDQQCLCEDLRKIFLQDNCGET